MNKKYLIVFCGMDGTGKSTHAKKVGEYLQNNNIPFQYYHAHGYGISKNSFGISDKQINHFQIFLSLLSPLAIIDCFINYYLYYLPILKKRALVCDRFFYDKVARLIFYNVISERVAKLYLRILPKPDLIFFLDVNPKIAFSRKSEYSYEEYLRFRNIYKFVAKCLSLSPISTSNQPEVAFTLIRNKIKNIIE